MYCEKLLINQPFKKKFRDLVNQSRVITFETNEDSELRIKFSIALTFLLVKLNYPRIVLIYYEFPRLKKLIVLF